MTSTILIANEIGGKISANPSGGFLSFGKAKIAQAALQIFELTRHVCDRAEGMTYLMPRPVFTQ